MPGISDLLSDPQVRDALMRSFGYLRDTAQGASNGAAGTVSMPVDAMAWLLRAAGVPVGNTPFGGSEWMRQMGLTREPESKFAGTIGESLGAMAPNMLPIRAADAARVLVASTAR